MRQPRTHGIEGDAVAGNTGLGVTRVANVRLMQEIRKILPFLLNRLDEQRLVFFIGAGIPASEAGLPSGSDLRDSLEKEIGESSSDGSLPEVAARYQSERDRPELYEFLKRNLTFAGDIRGERVCRTYKLLLDLPIQTFLTTNFDGLFESVAAAKGVPLSCIRADGQVANFKPSERSILKIHGDLEVAADQIVITSDDYKAYASKFPQFSQMIKSVFQLNTVVFLGYSLSDPNFKHLYESVLQSVGALKKKCFAVLASDPGPKFVEAWKDQMVEVVLAEARDFLRQLVRAYSRRYAKARQPAVMRVTAGQQVSRPGFSSPTAPNKVRKAFAYFEARQKALLRLQAYSFCTIETLLNSTDLLDPTKRVTELISSKAQEISLSLKAKGFYPEVLPPLDQVPEKVRRRKIEEADFCIVFVVTANYGAYLNRLYGALASKKPMLVFVHNNFHSRLREDLLFRGLYQAGADLGLFKTSDVTSCALRGALEEILERRSDEWLTRALNF